MCHGRDKTHWCNNTSKPPPPRIEEVPDVAPQGMQNVDFAEGMDDAARNAAVANTPPTPAYSAIDAVADPPYTPPTPADWPSNTSMNSDGQVKLIKRRKRPLQHGNIISKKRRQL